MQSDSLRVGGISLPLSLLVWEVLEHRDMARLSQICFLRPAQSLAMERSEHRNRAGLWAPEASCKISHPHPTAPVGGKCPRFQTYFNSIYICWRPPLTHVMDNTRLKHILALEMKYLLDPSEDLHKWNQFALIAEKQTPLITAS